MEPSRRLDTSKAVLSTRNTRKSAAVRKANAELGDAGGRGDGPRLPKEVGAQQPRNPVSSTCGAIHHAMAGMCFTSNSPSFSCLQFPYTNSSGSQILAQMTFLSLSADLSCHFAFCLGIKTPQTCHAAFRHKILQRHNKLC